MTAGPAASSVPTDGHGEPPIVRRSTASKLLRTAAGDPLWTICAYRLCAQVADSVRVARTRRVALRRGSSYSRMDLLQPAESLAY